MKKLEADELRRQLAEQHKANAKLRGMPNDENIVKSKKKSAKTIKKQSKTQVISDGSDIDIQKLRKSKHLRKSVNKELKNLGLIDDISSEGSDKILDTDLKLKGGLESEALPSKRVKQQSVDKSGKTEDSDTSLSYESSDSSSLSDKKKKRKKKKSGIRAKASDTVRFPQKYP